MAKDRESRQRPPCRARGQHKPLYWERQWQCRLLAPLSQDPASWCCVTSVTQRAPRGTRLPVVIIVLCAEKSLCHHSCVKNKFNPYKNTYTENTVHVAAFHMYVHGEHVCTQCVCRSGTTWGAEPQMPPSLSMTESLIGLEIHQFDQAS